MKFALFLAGLLLMGYSPSAPDLSAASNEELIGSLAKLDAETPGISQSTSSFGFIAADHPFQADVLLLGSNTPKTPPAMQELVRRKLDALPDLLRHLTDSRPTRIVVGVAKPEIETFGGQFFHDEYEPRANHASRFSCSLCAPPNEKSFDGQYAVKVGDVCFVLIGQIVNRRFEAVRYQPSSILIVNSPVAVPSLAEKVRKDWSEISPNEFRRSLLSDLNYAQDDMDEENARARLLFYSMRPNMASLKHPPDDPDEWMPDPANVAKADKEALLYTLPSEFGSLDKYARYYWGTVHRGHRVIQGTLVSGWERSLHDLGASHVVPELSAQHIADGGCSVVNVTYDLASEKVVNEKCNFELRPPPPPKS